MRMTKRGLSDPARRFRNEHPLRHSGRIGIGPRSQPKRAINLSVDAEILKMAKEMKINISEVLENTLRKLTEEERIRRFKEENKKTFASFNALIKRAGVFGEEFHDWDDDAV
jgi:antitoxin CcdA